MFPEIRRIGYGTPEHTAAVALRRAVLRTPLGLDFTPEQLAAEAADTHFAAFHDGRLVGTVVLTPYGGDKAKLRQMAVAEDLRGAHVGAQLLAACEAHGREQGLSAIVLAARTTAQGFYARHGYAVEGDIFIEVTLPHIQMSKTL